MNTNDKELLLKDLSTRLHYNVICYNTSLGCNTTLSCSLLEQIMANGNIYIKPFLRPLSSMTEKEVDELLNIRRKGRMKFSDMISECVEFYCSKHLDYNHLIEKGLALEAPDEMYNF